MPQKAKVSLILLGWKCHLGFTVNFQWPIKGIWRDTAGPLDPIFFTQAIKIILTHIQCLAMKDFSAHRILSMWQLYPCTSTNPPSQSRIAEGTRSMQDLTLPQYNIIKRVDTELNHQYIALWHVRKCD